MRILQIGPIPPEVGGRSLGGVATHLWALSAYLVGEGYVVGVLGDNHAASRGSIVDGIHLFGLRRTLHTFLSWSLFSPRFWRKALRTKRHFQSLKGWKEVLVGLLNYQRVISEFRPDIIHIHHLEYRFPLAYYLVHGEVPILTTVHSTSFIELSSSSRSRRRVDFVQRNLDAAQHLLFVSKFLKGRFENLFPDHLDQMQTNTVHHPVSGSLYYPLPTEPARDQLGLDQESAILLFAGKLIPNKGLDLLIQTARLLKNRGLRFQILVVGDGPQREQLEDLVRQDGLSEQIRFEGQKTQKDLFLYYNAADLFLLPSEMESFGLVFVEAMLCGCPVIGRPEVLQEILPSEHCGYYLPSSSPELWADQITQALSRAWSRDEISTSAQAFTWEAAGDKFERIYKEIEY